MTEEEVRRFHSGDRQLLCQLIRQHFEKLVMMLGKEFSACDRECIVQEVFTSLLDERIRQQFQGGSLVRWLSTITRNRAVDHLRRHKREILLDPCVIEKDKACSIEKNIEQDLLMTRILRELPEEHHLLFDLRIIKQCSQQEAAEQLGIPRTTLESKDQKMNRLLKRILERMRKEY